ncbi:hypothetical protein B0T22DRAFT_380279 [Podospora appendiculata]|uniref:Microbial-type PARG catalytic domain-containing protein n=1 Tax=Podospora appendiculata TaxID=314037 RepID=A0AAE1CDQ1_9PEZI|nr:hypothetical protein B0T22DRAFT_380279 [Podospora appendiculata]
MGTDRDQHQPALSRTARAKHSHTLINKTIPSILRGNARARRGVEAVELIVDPTRHDEHPTLTLTSSFHPQNTSNTAPQPAPTVTPPTRSITLTISPTLFAASTLSKTPSPSPIPHRTPPPRLAILNMASPLRPGGGLLTGATSQEESLCRRTTLYPSLHEHFYRLPEVGAIYTPDVLVFHSSSSSPSEEQDQTIDDKKDWFFIDVITASMLRFPDLEGDEADIEGRRYAEQKDREMVVRKMTAVMRILRAKGVGKVVLGAWGCGAYGNPVGEIARAWKRVLLGGPGSEQDTVGSFGEMWDGLEVVFAIKDAKMAGAFARAFGPELVVVDQPVTSVPSEEGAEDER